MVAILFTTYFGLTAVLSIVQLVHSAPTNTSVSLVGVICVGCLWCGLQKRKEALLLPFLLYLVSTCRRGSIGTHGILAVCQFMCTNHVIMGVYASVDQMHCTSCNPVHCFFSGHLVGVHCSWHGHFGGDGSAVDVHSEQCRDGQVPCPSDG